MVNKLSSIFLAIHPPR